MFMTIDGNKIYYNKLGNAKSEKTVLFIHGSAMCGKLMEGVANWMPEMNNITIDLPGHVNSKGEPIKTPELLAEFMEKAIIKLRNLGELTDDLTVAGYSLGGCITLELALRKVEGVKRIAVFNSCDFANTKTTELYAPVLEDFVYMDLAKRAYGRNSNPAESAPIFLANKSDDLSTYTDVMGAIGYELKDFDTISIPTIFVAGGEDQVAPLENIIKVSQMIPNAVLSVIPYHGHMSLLERPDVYASAIEDLIKHNA